MVFALCCVGHFLTDGVCAAVLFGAVQSSSVDLAGALLLYNTLAFSTQCVVGLLTDRLGRQGYITAAACVLTALGLLLPLPPLLRVAVVGTGNSFFHVGGGTVTLRLSENRAAKLGVFVAPGALGLTLGTLWPDIGAFFAAALCVCGLLLAIIAVKSEPMRAPTEPFARGQGSVSTALVLLIAVAARAFGGVAVAFPWKTGAVLTIVMTVCVALGKALGGFAMDRLGARRLALLSLPAAALLLALCSRWMLPSLAGQLLLNMTMPLTLLLIYRALPEEPGLAFGLAASALWPGHLAAQLLTLPDTYSGVTTAVCLLAGLVSILYSLRKTGELQL